MTPLRLPASLLTLAGLLLSTRVLASPERDWAPLRDRQVWIQTNSGARVRGKLTSLEGDAITLVQASGEVIIVKKTEVHSLRTLDDAGAPTSQVEEVAPTRKFAGVLFQPVTCLSKCDGSLATFGVELGSTFVAFALRYGYAERSHALLPDFRLHYEIPITRRISLTPLVEVTPGVTIVSPEVGDVLVLLGVHVRPGLRVGYRLTPSAHVFLEPVAVEATVYSRVLAGGEGSSTDTVVRYNLSVGIQYRY